MTSPCTDSNVLTGVEKDMKARKERKRKETRKKKLKTETDNNYTEVETDKPFINH